MKKTLICVSLSLALAACGGGGGSDDSSAPQDTRFTVTVTTSDGGSASPGTQTVTEGNTLAITLTANDGFELTSASGCSGELSGNTFTTGAITADCTVNASFEEAEPAVADISVTTSAGEGGQIYPASQTLAAGDQAFVTVVPGATSMLDDISGCDGSLKGNIYSFTAQSACDITASFTAQPDTSSRSNLGAQKTLVLPVSFAGRSALDGFSTQQLQAMFITQRNAINRYVVDGSEGESWLEPAILDQYELTATNNNDAPTSSEGLVDASVQISEAQRLEIYQHISDTVADYTSYDRLITVINDTPNQPYVCYASLGTITQDGWEHYVTHNGSQCVSKATLIHELGHTFGMRHTDRIACSTVPTETLSYRSSSDCPAGVAADSPLPMGSVDEHNALYSAVMRERAGWLTSEQVATVTSNTSVTLSQSSLPDGGVQLVRVPYGSDSNGNTLYITAELKTTQGLDRSLFSTLGIEDDYQVMISVPHTRSSTEVSATLTEAVFLTLTGDANLGGTEGYTDEFRDIAIEVTGTQGSGANLTANLSVSVPRVVPSVNLAVLPGASASESVTVSFTNNADSAVSGLDTALNGFNPDHFSITASDCNDTTLNAGDSCSVTVARTSATPGFTALRLTGNDGVSQQVEIEAIGINQPFDAAATLEWLEESDYPRMNLFEAIAYCDAKTDNGASDWRIASREELEAAFVNGTPPLDLSVSGLTRFFWSVSVQSGGASQILQVTPQQAYSIARSNERSAIRHAVCVRTL